MNISCQSLRELQPLTTDIHIFIKTIHKEEI